MISRRQLGEAAAALTLCCSETPQAPAELSRARALIYALAGSDRGLAAVAAPELIACRSSAEAAEYLNGIADGPRSHDYLSAAVVLTWSAEPSAAFDLFAVAHDRALLERRLDLAVAARERLAHHALLFGDVASARSAIEEAATRAGSTGLPQWRSHSLAVAARIALDAGDRGSASAWLERGRSEACDDDRKALFASTGAQLAVETGDDAALRGCTSPEVLQTALHSQRIEAAVAATIALLTAAGESPLEAPESIALRRALFSSENPASAPELFSLTARYGNLEEARLAADALGAVVAPDRPYLRAHYLLARAHLLFRCGERTGWVDNAGDAARAFNAMGLRRWTNEAMLLLVRQQASGERHERRGRPTGSALTGREQQVAHLIRRGARNREVALALQISEHTVERHVSSILGRLGLRSRWQIVDPPKFGER